MPLISASHLSNDDLIFVEEWKSDVLIMPCLPKTAADPEPVVVVVDAAGCLLLFSRIFRSLSDKEEEE